MVVQHRSEIALTYRFANQGAIENTDQNNEYCSLSPGGIRMGKRSRRQTPWWSFSTPDSDSEAVSTAERRSATSRPFFALTAPLRHPSTIRNSRRAAVTPREESAASCPTPSYLRSGPLPERKFRFHSEANLPETVSFPWLMCQFLTGKFSA